MMSDAFKKMMYGKTVLKDSDKDGLSDALDCKPHNKAEQGIAHTVKRYIKEKGEDWHQSIAANRMIKKKERAAYYQAKEEERLRYAKEKAKAETDQDIKRLREPKKGFSSVFTSQESSKGFGTFFSSIGSSSTGLSPSAPSSKPKYHRVKRTRFVKTKGGYKKVTKYARVPVKNKSQPHGAPSHAEKKLGDISLGGLI